MNPQSQDPDRTNLKSRSSALDTLIEWETRQIANLKGDLVALRRFNHGAQTNLYSQRIAHVERLLAIEENNEKRYISEQEQIRNLLKGKQAEWSHVPGGTAASLRRQAKRTGKMVTY